MPLFSFGIAFEVPVAVVLPVVMGIVPLEADAGPRLIAVFVIAATLTPPDAASQSVMAVPMYLLYEGGILLARLMARSKAKRQDPGDDT